MGGSSLTTVKIIIQNLSEQPLKSVFLTWILSRPNGYKDPVSNAVFNSLGCCYNISFNYTL